MRARNPCLLSLLSGQSHHCHFCFLFLVLGRPVFLRENYFFRDFLHRYADIPVALSEGKFSRRRKGSFEFNKKGIVEIGVTCKFM